MEYGTPFDCTPNQYWIHTLYKKSDFVLEENISIIWSNIMSIGREYFKLSVGR